MDDSFFAYIQLVELLGFFSGYPLLFTLITFSATKVNSKGAFKTRLLSNLPYAYALVGTLYLALQLKNLSPDFTIANITSWMRSSWLVGWALLSVLFWIPVIAKKNIFSLLHSLVFVLLIVKDIFNNFYSSDNYVLRNDMKLVCYSFLINLGAIIITTFVSAFLSRYRPQSRPGKK